GEVLSREECRQVLGCPDTRLLDLLAAAYRVRERFCGHRVHLHMLINAKSGLCPEDCHYCSQSAVSTAEIEKYPLVSFERLLAGARRAKEARSRRYCIVLSGRGATDHEIDALAEAVRRIKQEVDIGICCSVGLLTEERARRLREAGWTLALAESCTGGLISSMITAVPGSSVYFQGAVVAYQNEVKRAALGVEEATLGAHGAVSEQTAAEMAVGVKARLQASVGAAVSGVAGPGGGTREKPVGTVCAAVAWPGGVWTWTMNLRGSREQIRIRAAKRVLWEVYRRIGNGPSEK
ncbi:MAG: nicotinamide-nucleotide amidohydrolase family protein, partial [Alicyclobacillus shizuokensis]|nr:nicotinamide-nucleotide amidohydrolase family protein [Alicyclobacillus shizuokensis]